jgi:hypothetical protein
MKDEQASEEKMMEELDLMYRHVAELEGGQLSVEHNCNPNEPGQIPDQEVSVHAKIITFPGRRFHWPSGKSLEEEPSWKRKPYYRTCLIVASFSMISLVLVLLILSLNVMIGPRGSENGESNQLTSPIYSKPSPPVQKDENVLKTIERRTPQTETMPQQTIKSKSPFTKTKHYAIQVGAFCKWENASERMDALRNNNLEPYWIEMKSRNRGTIYIVFSGYFTERKEAVKFMKDIDILKNYPDSFIRQISL